MKTVLLSPYTISFALPLLLLFCGALAKKLVRGTPWIQKDFYLGVEFTLAAITSGMLYIYDLVKPRTPVDSNKVVLATGFVIFAFVMLFLIMSTHQDWEDSSDMKGSFWRLCIVSNIFGGGLVSIFIFVVKGV